MNAKSHRLARGVPRWPGLLTARQKKGVGHQPMYYDQLFSATGPYQRWTVTSVQVDIVFGNVYTSPNYAAAYFQVGTVDYPAITTLMEKPTVKKVLVGSSAGLGVKRLSMSVPVHTIFGVPRRKLTDDDVYSGFWNAGPSQVCYLIIMLYGLNGAFASNVVEVTLKFNGQAFGLCAASPS